MDALFEKLKAEARRHRDELSDWPVRQEISPDEIKAHLKSRYAFDRPIDPEKLFQDVARMLRDWNIHTAHPRYFGLYNPPALPISAVADALVALFNPQVGAWGHAPAANEMERHVLDSFAKLIGYGDGPSSNHFTSGGQEANNTALAAALAHTFPQVIETGLRELDGQPVFYVSNQAHHSFLKAAQMMGLGSNALRTVRSDDQYRMEVSPLRQAIAKDRANGHLPFMVVGTAGATGTGAIDPLDEIATIAREADLWFHVDAAWGGGALLSEKLRPLLVGIEHADSVTWDAHKWLCVSMGAGMFFCRRPEAVERAFKTETGYVPPPRFGIQDSYTVTAQWSRRFIGLKVFMAMAERGLTGYAAQIEHQTEMGEQLRKKLTANGWEVLPGSPLPVICTTHRRIRDGAINADAVAERVQTGGRAWLSRLQLLDGSNVLRACITSYETQPADLDVLVEELNAALDAEILSPPPAG